MNHLSDDEILQLAEIVEDQLIFTESQIHMMEHLKFCKPCYEKFCGAMTLLEVIGDNSIVDLSDIYEMKYAKSLLKQKECRTLAVVNLIWKSIHQKIEIVLEQVNGVEDAYRFQPSPIMATRGSSGAAGSVCKVEDTDDERSFIAVDPNKKELLLQINTKGLLSSQIKAFLQYGSGENIEIHMDSKGDYCKGKISGFPDKDAQLVIQVDKSIES